MAAGAFGASKDTTMPCYFFALDGDPFPMGPQGVSLVGPEKACSQAMVVAGEMLRNLDGRLCDSPGGCRRFTSTARARSSGRAASSASVKARLALIPGRPR